MSWDRPAFPNISLNAIILIIGTPKRGTPDIKTIYICIYIYMYV